MATLAEQVQDERMARIALSMIAEPNDPTTGYVLARHGGIETLPLIESDDEVPGLARADVLMWRERLAARITSGLLDQTERHGFGTLIPADKEWPAGLNDLGERAPYLLWTRGAASFLTTALSDRATITGSRGATSYGEQVAGELAMGLADDAPLVRVLDEAVRDGLIQINPAKNRAKRSLNRNAFRGQSAEQSSPRAHAIPDMKTLNRLASACGKVHQSYSDFVMLAALLAARSSEVSGLRAGDVDYGKNLVVIRRQVFPGKGGLVTKPTKSRKERRVPILEPLRPVLERLTNGKQPEDSLLVGPKGGYLTTATVRDATDWDSIVAKLGLPDLTRHGLRHTGATWMADAGIPLHVLQDILGHASMETTRGYLHPDDRHLASAAEQANAFFPPPGSASRPGSAAPQPGACDVRPRREWPRRRSGPLLVPLSTGKRVEAVRLSTGDHPPSPQGDQRGTTENDPRT
ncbi:tyrosine-type recombinase/integrase [Aestuariimicrobium ganziense]|uniref:tyrosine-type recombinase/integrase n=1 Tax=Aestuariimicrobium ganziense TaxID=2773677 RepID=UPI00194480DE|nr:tyrosine-type recombinase/integrase [Aestuariimicrobium ganziense]